MTNNVSLNNMMRQCFSIMYLYSSYLEHITKCNMEYYLINIFEEMGYEVCKHKKIKTDDDFKLDINKETLINNNIKLLDKYFKKEKLDAKMKQSIAQKLKILQIDITDKKQLTPFVKELIMCNNKFTHFLNFRKFLINDENIKLVTKNDFCEIASNSIYIKLKYYAELTTALDIEDNFKFSHNTFHIKFNESIDDVDLIKKLNEARKIFNIRGLKYDDFALNGGYKKAYDMCITICRQLFGSDFIKSSHKTIRNTDNSRKNIRTQYLNHTLYEKYYELVCGKGYDKLLIIE